MSPIFHINCTVHYPSGRTRYYRFTCSDMEDMLSTSKSLFLHAETLYGSRAWLTLSLIYKSKTND